MIVGKLSALTPFECRLEDREFVIGKLVGLAGDVCQGLRCRFLALFGQGADFSEQRFELVLDRRHGASIAYEGFERSAFCQADWGDRRAKWRRFWQRRTIYISRHLPNNVKLASLDLLDFYFVIS